MQKLSLTFAVILTLYLITGCAAGTTGTGTEISNETATEQPISEKIENVLSTELFSEENAVNVNLSEQSGTYKITAPGLYSLSGKLEGQLEISVSKDTKVKLILNGVDISNTNAAAISILSADKVIITSASGTVNNISSNGTFEDDDKADAAIYSKDDLTLNGEGQINISSTKHGIVSKNDLKLNGGNIVISASKKGIEGKDSITVNDGIYSVNSGTICIESEGDISIQGGELYLESENKDGIKTSANTIISDGKISIGKSAEGIEAQTITISGGDISIFSTDDGINASTTAETGTVASLKNGLGLETDSNANVTISGGNISIAAGGDGIDSNGNITISGGTVIVSTPCGNQNCALDFGIEGCITGGTVLASGDGEMVEVFSEQQSQGYILYCFGKEYSEGTEIKVYDSSDTELISFLPEQSFSSVVISSSKIAAGNTYKIVVEDDVYDVDMQTNAFVVNGTNAPGMNNPGNNNPDMKPGNMQSNGTGPQNGEQPAENMPYDGQQPPGGQGPHGGMAPPN